MEDGVGVSAYIDGVRISATVVNGGRFRLVVPQQPGESFTGKVVELRITVRGNRVSWPQMPTWQSGDETTISLEARLDQVSRGPRPDQARNESNPREDQRREEMGQDRLTQRERELADREERLRREVEFDRDQQRREREGSQVQPERSKPPGVIDLATPSKDEPFEKGPTRVFFTNSQIGQLGSVNQLLDPATLAVIGILITLVATTMQMMRGN